MWNTGKQSHSDALVEGMLRQERSVLIFTCPRPAHNIKREGERDKRETERWKRERGSGRQREPGERETGKGERETGKGERERGIDRERGRN